MTKEFSVDEIMKKARVPCVFLSYDKCSIETACIVNAYAGVEDILFLVPYNQEDTRAFYQKTIKPEIAFRLIQTDQALIPTMMALLDQCRDHEWLFWATADRLPYMRDGLAAIDRIARSLSSARPELDGIEGIRLTHWRDGLTRDDTTLTLAGVDFQLRPAGRFGHWHHQFIRRSRLECAVDRTAAEGTLMAFHESLCAAFVAGDADGSDAYYLVPSSPLLKFEEPTLNGRYTTNFFIRNLHDGQALDPETSGNPWSCRGLQSVG